MVIIFDSIREGKLNLSSQISFFALQHVLLSRLGFLMYYSFSNSLSLSVFCLIKSSNLDPLIEKISIRRNSLLELDVWH